MKNLLRIILFSTIFFSIKPLYSNPIQVSGSIDGSSIGLQLDILEDKKGTLRFSDIIRKKNEHKWFPSQKAKPGFGFTKSVYWVRFTLENTTAKELEVFLEQEYSLIDDLRFFFPEKKPFQTGDLFPFKQRAYDYRTFIFPIKLDPGKKYPCYMRFQSTSAINIHLKLWQKSGLLKKSFTEDRILMLYYGIILAIIIYNLFLFVTVRHTSYLYFILFLLSFLTFIMNQHGTAHQFLWPEFPFLSNLSVIFSLAMVSYLSFMFMLTFLQTEKHTPRFHKLCFRLSFIPLTVSVIALLTPFIGFYILIIKISAILTAITILFNIAGGILLNRKKQRSAYFYLLSWFIIFIGSLLYLAKSFAWLPSNFITTWSMQIGSAALVLLLSMGLGDKINTIRKELQILSENLELKVIERTTELESARDALWGEMELAKKIQTVLLPERPEIPGFELSVYMKPADEVGGDYYDVINVEGRDWIIIGDVSGHGVVSGIIMMMVQTSIQVILRKYPKVPPSELLTTINSAISSNIQKLDEDKYMTITVLSTFREGEFIFSGLHQDIMIYRRKQEKVEIVETNGVWIGIADDIEAMLDNKKLILGPEDVMLVYTDGITEAWEKGSVKNQRLPSKHMFGDKRLKNILLERGKESPGSIQHHILAGLDNYNCEDDVTMVIIKRNKTRPGP
ncbi:MAG: SpoIIE family protein phosphatase [bacterium]|nr:SpoIIE family protein phosphatase [bacterium]